MPDRIPVIQQALADAVTAIDQLDEKLTLDEVTLDEVKSTTRRLKVTTAITLMSVLLDIALTVLVGWGLFGLNHNQARINQLQAAVQSEADRGRAGQCAMVTLFLQFEPKTLSNPSYTDEQKGLQTQAYTTLRQIALTLECPT